jgi:16S rRNA processing protein RimM
VEPERLIVGRVAKAHGIRGEVAIDIYSDAPERFAAGAQVFAGERTLTIATSRQHQGRMLVRFENVRDRNDAERLRGVELSIDASDAAPLEEWSFYPHQLEGLTVVDEEGRTLGTMARVEESPGGDLWIVTTERSEVLVPAVREIVRSVDLEKRIIVVSPPVGMF